MSEWPALTVIVSTYQRPQLLTRQLDSLLHQDFTDYHIIVVYDGPADPKTVEVIGTYVPLFEERGVALDLLKSGDEPSGYYCVPCNMALGFARGDYCLFVDDDNEVAPGALRALYQQIEEGEVWPDGVYGRRRYVRDPGCPEKTKEGVELVEGESPLVPWSEEAARFMGATVANNFIDKGDLLVSRGAMWMLQQFTDMVWNPSVRRFGDYECFIRGVFFSGWRLKEIDKVVNIYHWTGQNLQITRSPNETPQGMTLDTGERMIPV